MKRIKFFIGTSCLAVAGVVAFAAKSSITLAPEYYYVPTGALAGCQLIPNNISLGCEPFPGVVCTYDFATTTPLEFYHVYEAKFAETGACAVPLFRPQF